MLNTQLRFSRALEGYIQNDAGEGARQLGAGIHSSVLLMQDILDQTEHRPWPLPRGRWVMAQVWHDLLFAHWPVDAALLRPMIPAALSIDTFEGGAWIAVVPFRMSGVRIRGTPGLPWVSAFPELNVRTYVTMQGKPGVWFFSLDAGNPLVVATARWWFHLPYFRARMSCRVSDGWTNYRSERTHRGASRAALEGKYRPAGEVLHPRHGSLEHFLTERYCLYAANSAGDLFRGEIQHRPWPVQLAEAEFPVNTMTEAHGIALPRREPLLHFALRQDVVVWRPKRVA